MALYTRSGDDGTTGLPSPAGLRPARVRKDDPCIAALGAVDELNAALGLCLAEAVRITHRVIRDALADVQPRLLSAGALLAARGGGGTRAAASGAPYPATFGQEPVRKMEQDIDALCADLPELKHFILPGGSELAARLHVARAVARRAERAVVAMLASLARPGGATAADPAVANVTAYLNRLSDLLFALARLANRDSGQTDLPWTAEGSDPDAPGTNPRMTKA